MKVHLLLFAAAICNASADPIRSKRDSSDSECEDELESCHAALLQTGSGPSYLFVQLANDCTLERHASDTNLYLLSTTSMRDSTMSFTDRPFRLETSMKTKDFFDDFDETFGAADPPNAAFTFVDPDTEVFEDVAVAIVVDSVSKEGLDGDDVRYSYRLHQSDEQAEASDLDSYFGDGGGDAVRFEHCSIFIDHSHKDPSKQGGGHDWFPEGYMCGDECKTDDDCQQGGFVACPKCGKSHGTIMYHRCYSPDDGPDPTPAPTEHNWFPEGYMCGDKCETDDDCQQGGFVACPKCGKSHGTIMYKRCYSPEN